MHGHGPASPHCLTLAFSCLRPTTPVRSPQLPPTVSVDPWALPSHPTPTPTPPPALTPLTPAAAHRQIAPLPSPPANLAHAAACLRLALFYLLLARACPLLPPWLAGWRPPPLTLRFFHHAVAGVPAILAELARIAGRRGGQGLWSCVGGASTRRVRAKVREPPRPCQRYGPRSVRFSTSLGLSLSKANGRV